MWQPEGDELEVLAARAPAHPFLKSGYKTAFAALALGGGGRPLRRYGSMRTWPASRYYPRSQSVLAQGIHSLLDTAQGGRSGHRAPGHLRATRPAGYPTRTWRWPARSPTRWRWPSTSARLNAEVQDRRRQSQALSRRLVELQEQERRALSRDLHDTSGQNIGVLKLGLGALKRSEGCSEAVRAAVDELLGLADTVAEELHRLAVNLRPSSLDHYGLLPALEQLLTEFTGRPA